MNRLAAGLIKEDTITRYSNTSAWARRIPGILVQSFLSNCRVAGDSM